MIAPDDYPIGEYLDVADLPRPTILTAIQDIERLKTRIADLERENYHLRLLVDQARAERDAAYVQAYAHRRTP